MRPRPNRSSCFVAVLPLTLFSIHAARAASAPIPPSTPSTQSIQSLVIPIEEAKFVPVDAKRPELAAIAVLSGDPTSGPSTMLLRMARGSGRLHVHTADYRLVIVRGTMKHWSPTLSEASAPELGPGSSWFQPGGDPHGDSCLTDDCLMYISWSGARDGRLAPSEVKP